MPVVFRGFDMRALAATLVLNGSGKIHEDICLDRSGVEFLVEPVSHVSRKKLKVGQETYDS